MERIHVPFTMNMSSINFSLYLKAETMDGHLNLRKNSYFTRAKRHSAYSVVLTLLHYAIGWPQVILTVIITSINGATQFDTLFVLGVCASVLSVTLVFFKILDKAGRHSTSKDQYTDLALDIEQALLDPDEAKINLFEVTMLEREKMISQYAPTFCLDVFITDPVPNQ